MESIFDEFDKSEETEIRVSTVYIVDAIINENLIIHEGSLIMKVSEVDMREGYFILLYDRLIMTLNRESRIPIGMTSIKWKRIEPFAETDIDNTQRFGFKL